jgi:hypothetical protein
MSWSNNRTSILGAAALVVPLFAILAGAIWYAAHAWIAAGVVPMPATGYVAMTLGVLFSVVIGAGLMALLFYSSRHGYDEAGQGLPARRDEENAADHCGTELQGVHSPRGPR